MRETWYVLDDGTPVDPNHVVTGADGRLAHEDGRAVAYGPHGPLSTGVDVAPARDMEADHPAGPKRRYKTREAKAE